MATWASITLTDGEQRAAFIVGQVVTGMGAMAASALLSVPATLSEASALAERGRRAVSAAGAGRWS